jgi:DNA-binding transcriptional regulator YiaG
VKNTTRKKVLHKRPSDKTRWAYMMEAVEPKSELINKMFPDYHPQWVRMSQKMTIGGANFMMLRLAMGMTIEQCAAYLRVTPKTIFTWEHERAPVPFAEFELMRVVLESVSFKLSHPEWNGWFIDEKNGKLVSPDERGNCFAPGDLNMLSRAIAESARLSSEVQHLQTELNSATAENTRLRQMFLSQGVVDELASMQDRLNALIAGIATAHVIPFPSAEGEQRKERVA